MTKYIQIEPTEKQVAFLLLNCMDAFYGGAGQPINSTGIYTPYGKRLLKNIEVGDRICHPNGSNCNVIKIHKLGIVDNWRFIFNDGSSTVVTEDHLWKYSIVGKSWKIGTTKDLINKFNIDSSKFIIPLISEPIQFTKFYRYDYRQIHPYFLGVLLGDGCITNNVSFINIDEQIINEVFQLVKGKFFHSGVSFRLKGEKANETIFYLKRLGLFGLRRHEKFIPECYKYSTKENRFGLLKGLMDTNGTVNQGKASFCSTSKFLAEDVQWLVRSLGGNATITGKVGKYKKNGKTIICKDAYNVYIRMKNNSDIFFLNRKKEKVNKYNNDRCELKKRIKKIEYLGKDESWCITIDALDGLYITDDFIVTHNCGGGKSIALLSAALQYVDCPRYNALLIRDTYANLSMPGSLMDVAEQWLSGTDAHWVGEKKKWVFPNKSTLSFGYLDGPRDHLNYKSSNFHYVGIDESSDIRGRQAIYLFSRLRKLGNDPIPLRFRCASNPPDIENLERGEWVKIRYVDPLTRERDVVFIPAKMSDNPFLNEGEYRKALAKLDPVTRRQLELGDWNVNVAGEMFNRAWFDIVDVYPVENIDMVRYWDMAATEKKPGKEPAYSCGVLMSRTKQGIYYIHDVVRFRKKPYDNERIIRQTADIDGIGVRIFMEMEPGSSGKIVIDTYKRRILNGYAFKGDKVSGSKITRAKPFSTQCEAGNIKLVKGVWNKAYLDEAELFPYGQFKDQIDASSGAFGQLSLKRKARVRVL